MATPLFSRAPEHPQLLPGGSTTLLQFKAGRCLRDGNTDWVRPDPRRGTCCIMQDSDGIITFTWKHKGSTAPEESWITFPGDIDFVKVAESSGRVYVLKFHSSPLRQFFWMQDQSDKFDTKIAQAVVGVINGGDDDDIDVDEDVDEDVEEDEDGIVEQEGQEGDDDHDDDNDGNNEKEIGKGKSRSNSTKQAFAMPSHHEASALAGESGKVLMQSLPSAQVGGVPSEMATDNLATTIHDDIIPASVSHMQEVSGISGGYTGNRVLLSEVMTPEALMPLLEDPHVCQALFPTLPDQAAKSKEELLQTINSAQFHQALKSLDYAIETGQMMPLAQSFGLPPNALTSVKSFLAAIKAKVQKEKTDNSKDEDMKE